MNVAVVTDSTSDIHGSLEAELNVTVVPLYVHFQDQVRKDYLEIKTNQIFDGVKAGAGMPSTSQPTPVDFSREYERLLLTHDHVLSIHLSSKLSICFRLSFVNNRLNKIIGHTKQCFLGTQFR